jgi:hypothetical protein
MNEEAVKTVKESLSSEMQEYRRTLTALEQDSQVDYDKAILTLSGGALGISFAFFNNISGKVPTLHAGFLVGAWLSWALSLTAALIGFYASVSAFRKVIKQIDDRQKPDVEKANAPTRFFNKLAGFLFVIGVFFAIAFLYQNLR